MQAPALGKSSELLPAKRNAIRGARIKITRFTTLYGWSLILGSLAVLAAFFVSRVNLIREPFEHNYAEGIILYQILHVLPLSDAYRPITNYPHIVFHYTPLYHVLAKLIGQTVMGSFYAARTLSFVASLLVGAVCGYWVFLGSSRWLSSKPVLFGAAMSASAFVLRSASVTTCSALIRSDMFGIGLAMLGLLLFVRFGNGKISLWVSLLLFVAGLYCKQTLIGAPIACLVALWLMNRRTFLIAVIFLLLVGGGVMVAMELATSGQFVRHVFFYNINPFSVARVVHGMAAHLSGAFGRIDVGIDPVFLCGLAMLAVNVVAFRKHWRRLGALLTRSTRVRAAFCASALAIAGMATSISVGKAGSAENYFLEWDIAFAILAGSFLAAAHASVGISHAKVWRTAAVTLSLIWFLSSGPFVYRGFITSDFMKQRSRTYLASYGQLVPWIDNQDQMVLSEDMMLLVMAGKPVPMEPAIFWALSQTGAWDERPFVERIYRREFAAIIVIHELNQVFTREMVAAIEANYCEGERVGPYHIYRPSPECHIGSTGL
jgi:hypothetical protein